MHGRRVLGFVTQVLEDFHGIHWLFSVAFVCFYIGLGSALSRSLWIDSRAFFKLFCCKLCFVYETILLVFEMAVDIVHSLGARATGLFSSGG